MVFITDSGKEIHLSSNCNYKSLEKFAKETYQAGKYETTDYFIREIQLLEKIVSSMNYQDLIDYSKRCEPSIRYLCEVIAEQVKKKNTFKPIRVHCPICDNAIFSDMKYCNRCGADQTKDHSIDEGYQE